ncbi:MAG: acylphosphatase, partial [Terriglobales bacterium]
MPSARLIKVRGVVQGVGFRPFVYRIATELHTTGWVLNGEEGVAIHVEGDDSVLEEFLGRLKAETPPAAHIVEIEVAAAAPEGFQEFSIRES